MDPSGPSDDLAIDIANLWQRLLPETTQRLTFLDRAATAAATGTLNPALQTEAAAIAHKFAGSLGMFGFHEGTRLARDLEHHLNSPAPDPAALATLITQLRRSLPGLHHPPPRSRPEEFE